MLRTSFLILIFTLSFFCSKSQSGCIDPTRISPYFPCPDPSYKPVCGCDGKTYRNICEATYRFGVNQYTDGTCSGFEFDIIPTIVSSFLNFTFVQNYGNTTPAHVQIIGYMGTLLYDRSLRPDITGRIEISLSEVTNFRPGPYIIIVFNGEGKYQWKRFLKASYD